MKNMKRLVYILGALVAASLWGGWATTENNSTAVVAGLNNIGSDSVFSTVTSLATPIDTTPIELSFNTADEALKYMEESEHWREYQSGILPQMASTNLDYVTRLLNNTHDGFIVVDKGRMKLIRFDKYGEPVATYGMACGKNYGTKHKRSDCRTPEGFFAVKRVQNSTDWKYVDDDGNVSQKTGEFGPRFIRLDIPGITSIGIHGTCAPWSIGGRRSHGCIRLKNENIMELVDLVEVGMPVIVSPGTKDQKINKEEGYDIPRISTVVDTEQLHAGL